MKRLLLFTIVVAVTGCVDVIKLQVSGGGTLVVDGLITNDPGPYTIQLSRSVDFDNNRPVTVFADHERNATITISDNTGFSETLVEYQPGYYRTKDIQGAIGKTYKISIHTKDGGHYTSASETMPPVADIDRLEFEFIVYDHFFINANGSPVTSINEAFNIYSVLTDPPGKGNFYRWTSDGIYEFFTKILDPTRDHCWMNVDRLERKLQLSDDHLYDGTSFRQLVCTIPYDKPWHYLVKMRQQSLTEAAYNYWKVSENQQSSTGSLFDPPPAIIQGNITNETDPSETVLGFFGASAYTRKNLLLNRQRDSGFADPIPFPVEIPVGDCTIVVQGATNIKPDGFD